jgi:lipopolysaccharide export system protein LptA
VEGEAERIEYDGKLEIVKFFSKARVAQLEGSKVTQQAVGPYISYNSRTEEVAVLNSVTGESKKGGGRVEFTFKSNRKAPPAAPATQPAAPAPVTK